MRFTLLIIAISFIISCTPKSYKIEGCYCTDKLWKDTMVFKDSNVIISNGEECKYSFFHKNKFTIDSNLTVGVGIYRYKIKKDKIVTWFGIIRPVRRVYKKCE